MVARRKPLKAEAPDANEFAGLLRSGLARLKAARNTTLALENRFDLACNTAHLFSLAALRHPGYRPGRRNIVFHMPPHTLGPGPEVWGVLDKRHNTRDLGEYEGLLEVDERLISDLSATTQAELDALQAKTA